MNGQSFTRLTVAIFMFCFHFISESSGSSRNADARDSPFKFRPGINKRPYSRRIHGPHMEYKNCPKPEILDPRNIEATRKAIEHCTDLKINCHSSKHSKYRTIDGSCNNIQHPSWGMSDTCLKRILPFDFADGISWPRESCTGCQLPNTRQVSNVFHKTTKTEYGEFTTHFMEWGQFVSHDLSKNDIPKTPESGYNFPITCCPNGTNSVYNDVCISPSVPKSDPFFPQFGVTCVDIARTVPCRLGKGGPRLQSNQNTAGLDLSPVYGSNENISQALRSKSGGMLKMEYNGKHSPILPRTAIQERCESPPGKEECYYSGDDRMNQNPFILSLHISFALHHNFICQELAEVNPHWDDERLYQEARRINIAIVQWITYGIYLPIVLGELIQKEGIHVRHGDQYTKYNPHLDPSISSEFSAAAGRYGHSQIGSPMLEVDSKTYKKDTIFLRDYFHRPFGFRYGQYDNFSMGMTIDKLMKRDAALSDDVRNFLYRRVYLNETFGIDLAAVSIARGRDHGIPGYTYYLKYFYNKDVRTFDDLRGTLPDESVDLLQRLFKSVHDIDLYSAGLAEYSVPNALVGPVFGAILVEQYKRTKFGDRYWFEHGHEAGSFPKEQLAEIKNSSPSMVLCDTTKAEYIQRNVFLPPSKENKVVSCQNIHKFNFLLWKDKSAQS